MTDAEIIRAVAEKVMGWTVKIRDFPRPGHCWIYDNDGNEIMALHKWDPLHNANHTLLVIERMGKLGWHYEINDYHGDHEAKFVHWSNPNKDSIVADADLEVAVCLAALKAVKGE